MGNCTSGRTRDIRRSQVSSTKGQEEQNTFYTITYDPRQLACLSLIYQDLVLRASDKKMSAKIFQLFFHMNPTFGAPLFRKFSKDCGNQITEDMFRRTVLRFYKESMQQKMKFLFCLYDLDESKGVSYDQFLAILLASPQGQLKDILSNDAFLQTLSVQEMSYYLMTSKKLNSQSLQKEYKQNMTLFPYLPQRRKSSCGELDPSFANLKLSLELKNMQQMTRRKQSNQQKQKQDNRKTGYEGDQKSQDSQEQKINQNRQYIIKQFKKKMNRSVYSTQILRRYAQYIFKKNNLNKQFDQISYEKFRYIVKQNPKIYKQCFQGFHQYLWLHENGVPKYKLMTPSVAGYCIEAHKDIKKKIFMISIRDSLLIFQNQNMNNLISIKNLQGLNIESIQNQQGYGFTLKHQDGYYPEKMYIFPTKQMQKNWLTALNQYLLLDVYKKYRQQQKIGQGSFCSVYKCVDLQDNSKKAMKIFPKLKRTNQQIQTLNSQSQMLATCIMPNVVRAYQRFQTKQYIYIIMQLIQGGSLFQYVSKEDCKNFSQTQTRRIMRALLETVKNLHDIGIIHRDLKLQNILMKQQNGQYIPKIIDFGLAIHKVDLATIEEHRKFVGTPNFVPPQMFFHDNYDQTIDIFSLGVILHFMLTGTLPFNGLNITQIRQLTVDCHLNFQSKKWRRVSEQAKDLVSQMICYRQYRITAEQALNHNWFTHNHE